MDYALRASGLTLPAAVHYHRALGDLPGAVRYRQLPLTSTEPGGLLAFAARRIPAAALPTKIPAGRRSNRPVPAPGGQPAPTPGAGLQQSAACHVEHTGLPFRSPGVYLHPQLRRPPVAGCCCAGGRSR